MADPFGERGDFLRREFLLLVRHRFDVLTLGVVNRENEAAQLGLARDNDWPDFTAFENESPGVEAEAGLLLLGTMAFVAVFD